MIEHKEKINEQQKKHEAVIKKKEKEYAQLEKEMETAVQDSTNKLTRDLRIVKKKKKQLEVKMKEIMVEKGYVKKLETEKEDLYTKIEANNIVAAENL